MLARVKKSIRFYHVWHWIDLIDCSSVETISTARPTFKTQTNGVHYVTCITRICIPTLEFTQDSEMVGYVGRPDWNPPSSLTIHTLDL